MPVAVAGAASGVLSAVRIAAAVLGIAFQVSLLQELARTRAADALAGEGRFDALTALGTPAEAAELARRAGALREASAGAFALTLLVAAGVMAGGIGASLLLRSHRSEATPAVKERRAKTALASD